MIRKYNFIGKHSKDAIFIHSYIFSRNLNVKSLYVAQSCTRWYYLKIKKFWYFNHFQAHPFPQGIKETFQDLWKRGEKMCGRQYMKSSDMKFKFLRGHTRWLSDIKRNEIIESPHSYARSRFIAIRRTLSILRKCE